MDLKRLKMKRTQNRIQKHREYMYHRRRYETICFTELFLVLFLLKLLLMNCFKRRKTRSFFQLAYEQTKT